LCDKGGKALRKRGERKTALRKKGPLIKGEG